MNIYDLAKKAGVSISTASKALNGRHDVNEATRLRILAVCERAELLLSICRWGPRLWLHRLAEVRDHACVDGVRLGQAA